MRLEFFVEIQPHDAAVRADPIRLSKDSAREIDGGEHTIA